MKLICMLRVRNALERLPTFFEAHPFVDLFCVIDNGSEDGTVDWLKARQDVVLRQTESLDGRRDLNILYGMVGAHQPDWVLWLDDDELLEERAKTDIHELLDDPVTGCWLFHLYPFVMSTEFYRVDGPWAQFTKVGQPRLWRYQPQVQWLGDNPAHPGMPQRIAGHVRMSPLRIRHMTIMSPEEAERKIKFNLDVDPDKDFSHLREGDHALYRRWVE